MEKLKGNLQRSLQRRVLSFSISKFSSVNIALPCRYQEAGCTAKFCVSLMEEHEKECRYATHKCPFFIVDTNEGYWFAKCKWTGPSLQLEQHIRNGHKDEYYANARLENQSQSYLNYKKYSWQSIVFTFDRVFLFYAKIIGNYLHMCYMYVGAREDNNYNYTVSIKTTDGRHSATLTLPCPDYQEFINDKLPIGKFPNEKCVVFYNEFAKRCLNEEEKLPFEYRIFQN